MKDNLIEIIEQYLTIETNYSVVINGGYGIGKTYFFKNSLAPKIKEVSIPRDEQKKYLPIHISLFGINSVEEVQTQIFLALYPILKNRGIKLAAGIGKSIIRGIAQFNKLGDIDKYIADIDVNTNDWINYDELVLCFDDLDRKSDNLNIKDILGFVNTLVENHGAKIIIIANEKTLQNDEDYTSELKEKVIGVSIQFNSDIYKTYDLIIKERYSSAYKLYFEYLQKNKAPIIEIIKKNEDNLRNLIFFLEHFKVIFYPLLNLFDTDKDFYVLKEERLKVVLNFTLAITIEYKVGNLNSSNFHKIQRLNELSFQGINSLLSKQVRDKEEGKKSYADIFKEKYFSKDNYYYLDSIFKYIIGQSAFEIGILKEELEKLFVVKDGNIPESQKTLNSLGYFNCLELNDKEYRKMTIKMLEYVDQGKFQLTEYPTAFHFATRFNNVLGFNIKKLKKRFIKGIDKGNYDYMYSRHLRFKMAIDENTEFKEDLSEVIKYCFNTNENIEKSVEEENLRDLKKLFETDFTQFLERVKNENSKYRSSPFWLDFSLHKVYLVVNKLRNCDLIELAFYFQDRYRVHIFEKLYPEKDFLINLKSKINFPQKRKTKNLRNASLDFLIKHIDECINNFPR